MSFILPIIRTSFSKTGEGPDATVKSWLSIHLLLIKLEPPKNRTGTRRQQASRKVRGKEMPTHGIEAHFETVLALGVSPVAKSLQASLQRRHVRADNLGMPCGKEVLSQCVQTASPALNHSSYVYYVSRCSSHAPSR